MPKIIIAAGGTGGHLFPAQAFARELLEKHPQTEIQFVGYGLSENRCFQKELFSFCDVSSATPYLSKNPFKVLRSLGSLFKGVLQSWRILTLGKPSLVLGFGSFHSFPMLLAALVKRIPIVLFESDFVPGKVNRLFARWAQFSAIQYAEAASHLKGVTIPVNMPLWVAPEAKKSTCEEARLHFGLDPAKLTFLVFGGSQGSVQINRVVCEALSLFPEGKRNFQVVHLVGKRTRPEEMMECYKRLKIPACVKEFEEKMALAWRASNLVVCRAGASSLAEQIAFEVPGILIPYPYATDDHQKKNAQFMEKEIGGAVLLNEVQLTAEKLCSQLQNLLDLDQLIEMQARIRQFKEQSHKKNLSSLIHPFL